MVILLALLTACDATCRQACSKLVDCQAVDNSGTHKDECQEACLAQNGLYEDDWEDETLTQAFNDQRNCIRDSTCDDIAAGECYDETLWSW